MKTITAGDVVKIKIVAKDEQSGVKKVIVEACNLKDLPSSPSFSAKSEMDWANNSDVCLVEIFIPEYIPDSRWNITTISLINGAGRTKQFSSNKDFSPIIFKVQKKAGVDLTPAELISATLEE